MRRWLRHGLLALTGAGFMFGLVLLANPRPFGATLSIAGAGLSVAMIVVAIRTYRAG
ncbi:MAG: hypothetical protein JSV95_04710 [Gemmatimonadota bacterium]|nr:MAG: hypothetical protein JSV95_04710 [Gemmatimonadota bacterium]